VATLLSMLYVAFVLTWQGLRFTPVGEWWPFELLDIFGLLIFAPLPLFLLLSMLCASRAAGLWLLAPLAVLAWDYGGLALPQRPPTDGIPLRVMTANLLVSNQEQDRVSALIVVEQPDIVAIQELGAAMADALVARRGDDYPHRLLTPSGAPDGMGLLSRHPFRVEKESGWSGQACGCQRVTIEVGGRLVTFVNVHPPPPAVGFTRLGALPIPVSFDRTRTGDMLAAALDGVDPRRGPTVVAGDFNIGDRQPLYRHLRRTLRDAHRDAGWGLGLTFPSLSFEGFPDLSVVRIDYVLYGEPLAARAAHSGTIPGSDHRYVVADLLILP